MIEILPLAELTHFIPTLARWHQHEWAYLNPNTKSIESRIAEFQSHLSEELIPSTVVAVENSELMGSASLIQHDLDSRLDLFPWLASVFVAPEFRRRGVGGRLVRRITDLAFEGGVETLYLYTTDRETYYQHFGWTLVEHTTHNGVPIVIMSISAG